MSKEYVVFDLREIARELGDAQFNMIPPSEHIAWCDCGSAVPQDVDRCPGCGISVVWKSSHTWKQKFEHPNDRIKRFLYSPEDEAGQYLMRRTGEESFRDRKESQRWNALTDALGPDELREITDYCAQKARGRGLIRYVLNAAEKRVESLPSAGPEGDFKVEVIG